MPTLLKRGSTTVSSCEVLEIFKNTDFEEQQQTASWVSFLLKFQALDADVFLRSLRNVLEQIFCSTSSYIWKFESKYSRTDQVKFVEDSL